MTRKMIKCENEITDAIFKIAKKYGYEDIGVTGTIDPAWYKTHLKFPSAGLSVLFVDYKEK